jgi:hypothetical protein
LRGHGGIDEIAHGEREIAVQDAQVVIAAMEDLQDVRIAEELAETCQIHFHQRIDDEVLLRN